MTDKHWVTANTMLASHHLGKNWCRRTLASICFLLFVSCPWIYCLCPCVRLLQATDGFLFVVQCDTGRVIYVSDSITPVLNQSQVCCSSRQLYPLLWHIRGSFIHCCGISDRLQLKFSGKVNKFPHQFSKMCIAVPQMSPFLRGGSGLPSNTWFIWPTRVP